MTVLRTAFVNVMPKTDQFASELSKRLRRIDAKKDGDRIGKSAGDGLASGFLRGAGSVGKAASQVSSKIALIGGGAASAASGIGQLAGALAPAAGALVALPASMLAIKAASATVKIATAGVGEAISAGITGTAKQAEAALKELPPAARTFAKSIISLKPQIESLKSSVSERFFRPMQDDIGQTASVLLPLLKTSMSDLAGPLGGLGEQFLQTARKAQVLNGISNLFYGTGDAVVRLRPAVDAAGTALGSVLTATSSLLPGIASGFSDVAVRAGAWVSELADSGRLNEIFAAAVVTLKDLGGILANIGSILGSVFSAASSGGGSLLTTFRELTGQFAAFLKSAEGQQALTALFDALGAIATVVRTTLATALPLVGQAIGAIAPLIPPIVAAVGSLLQALAPIIPVAVQLATFIGQVLGKALQTLVPVLVPIISTVVEFAGTLISQLLPAFQPIIGLVIEFAGTMGKTLLAVLQAAMPALTALVGAVVQLMPALLPLQRAVMDLAMAFLPLLPAVVGLAATLIQALLPVLVPIIAKVAEFATAIVRKVVPVVQALVGYLTTGLGPTLSWLGGLFATIWKAISGAVEFAWKSVILPVVDALVGFFRTVIAPTVKFLYENVFRPVFAGVSAVVEAAWVVIQVALGAFKLFLERVIFPVVKYLYNKVIKPVFEAVGTAISFAYNNVIKPVFGALKTAFGAVGSAVKAVWENTLRPVFDKFGGFLKNTVEPAFKKGVEAIKKAWEKVKDAAKVPIAFVVNSVVNPLIGGINKAADFVGVKDKIPKIEGFASGGQIPGMPSVRDNRLAAGPAGLLKVASGEFITNTRSTLANLPLLHAINRKRGRVNIDDVDPYLDGYQRGGLVGDGIGDFFGKVVNGAKGLGDFITNPKGALKKLAEGFLAKVPAAGRLTDMLLGMGRRLVNGAGSWLADKVSGGGGIGNAGVAGGWKGMQALISQRFPGLGLVSGFRPGSITVTGNRSYHSMGRAVDYPPNRALAAWIKSTYGAKTKELITPWQELNLHNGRPHRYTGRVWDTHNFAGGNAHVHWAARNGGLIGRQSGLMPFGSYDSGGYLPTGLSIAHNGTGRPEPVGHNLGGGDIHLHFHGPVASKQAAEDMVVDAIRSAQRKRRIS